MSQMNGVIPILPTNDLGLNVFLYNIAENITEKELNSLKFLCIGTHDGIPKREQEKIRNAQDLFQKLRELQVITRENLLTLQAMIWHIGRKDLYEDFVKFCETTDKTLHFSEHPLNKSEQNKSLWRFHVRGHTTNGDLNYLNKLRDTVAVILCCPTEKIFIRGVRESQSIFVFLAIPKLCDDVLQNLSNTKLNQLLLLGVDDIKKVEYIKTPSQPQLPLSVTTSPDKISDVKEENTETVAEVQKQEFVRQTSKRDAMIRLSGSEHPELDSVIKKIERFQQKIESGSQQSRHGIHLIHKTSFGNLERDESVRKRKQRQDRNLLPVMSARLHHDSSIGEQYMRPGQQGKNRVNTDSGFEDHSQEDR